MYEEKKYKFDWKGFLLKFAFIIVVAVLVIKLLPLNLNNKNNGTTSNFQSNLTALQDAGSSYFTTENLPTEVGASVQVSLAELIEAEVIKELKNSKKQVCDSEASYVKATKNVDNYQLEVNLICEDEKETVHVYLGCFDSCPGSSTTTTTTKKPTTTPKKTTTQSQVTPNPTTKKTTKATTTTEQTTPTKKPTTTTQLKYAVIFNSNGGSKVAYEYVLPGKAAMRPISPTRPGYTFIGWYYNGVPYDFNTPVYSNRIIIAKWEAK